MKYKFNFFWLLAIVAMVSVGINSYDSVMDTGKYIEGMYTVVDSYSFTDLATTSSLSTDVKVLLNKETNHKIQLSSKKYEALPAWSSNLSKGELCYIKMKVFKNKDIRVDSCIVYLSQIKEVSNE